MVGVRRGGLVCVLVGLVAAGVGTVSTAGRAGAAASGPAAWVLGGMTRVLPTTAAGTATDARLSAARGETEPFQVAVSAVGAPVTGAALVLSDLVGPGGARIAS